MQPGPSVRPIQAYPTHLLIKILLIIAIFVLLGMVFSGAYLWRLNGMDGTSQAAPKVISTAPVSGTLLLSLSRAQGPAVPFNYSFAANKILNALVDLAQEAGALTLHYEISPNALWGTFVAIHANGTTQVYRADFSSGDTAATTRDAIRDATAISSADTSIVRFPVVSDSGTVAYMKYGGAHDDVRDVTPAHNWSIVVSPRDGTAKNIEGAIYPKWIDTDHIVFMKDEGLYYYSVSEGSTELVLSASETITTANTYAVSPGGNMLAISMPSQGNVRIFEVSKWSAAGTTLFGTIPLLAIFPTFSPDGNLLALVLDGTQDPASPLTHIGVYDLQTHSFSSASFDLLGYDPGNVTISGWMQ